MSIMVHNVMVYMSIFTSQRRMSAFWLGIYDEETIDTAREVAMMEYTVFFYINFYIGNLWFKICKIIAVVVFKACQFLREYIPCSLLSVHEAYSKPVEYPDFLISAT